MWRELCALQRVQLLLQKIKLQLSIGVEERIAADEACMIEHVISDETYECLDRFINTRMNEES